MTVSRFRVAAMDCAAEEQLVRMALGRLEGVDRVQIDLSQREVSVDHHRDPSVVAAALAQLDLGAVHLDDAGNIGPAPNTSRERRALMIALIINLGFFVGELAVGLVSGSMGLVADALDMGADAAVYGLGLAAVGTAASRTMSLARTSGYLQFGLAMIGLAEVVRRALVGGEPPDVESMIVLSLLAMVGNVITLVLLAGVRSDGAHLQASWIFTANDIKVNALVIAAAVAVVVTDSPIPDLVAGALIFLIVANGARRILRLSGSPTNGRGPGSRPGPRDGRGSR